ncbi:MAG: DUF1904 family protein [Bacteroidales bacterium]
MPTIRFHAVCPDKIGMNSAALIKEISQIYNLPQDHVSIEVVQSRFFDDNGESMGFPLVEVLAFKRPVKVEDQVAKAIYNSLLSVGYDDSECYFLYVEGRHYYANGEHF